MKNLILGLLFLFPFISHAQKMPSEFHLSDNGKLLYRGGNTPEGFYNPASVKTVELTFEQPNYWRQLSNNYASETPIEASMIYDGQAVGLVGVRFRGNTSYQRIRNSEKKPFKIDTDFVEDELKIEGYKNLKFNNAHEDPSFMREVLYSRMASPHVPMAKANYIHLYINGEDWGLYPNIQAIDKTFLEEWFLSNDGALFRATTDENNPGGGGGGGGPQWGDGTAGLNYLDSDTSSYQEYYFLKSSDMDYSWEKLVDACQVLDNASEENTEYTEKYLDVDKILWYLATENIFTDDDSYIHKGKMDYLAYYEPETGRLSTLEYDGNSSFNLNSATSSSWSPFKNVSNNNYPLLNKLLNIPKYRQRYLAHYRTILLETFTPENANAIIDEIDAQISDLVATDPKKLYSTIQYTNAIPRLKEFVASRRNYLLSNTEVGQKAPAINKVVSFNSKMEEYIAPHGGEPAYVQAEVSSEGGIHAVYLYYGSGITGGFTSTIMYDDGAHEDELANDGIFGAEIPGFEAGSMIRYYVEAIADNSAKSASYMPSGAEHDVFVYRVQNITNGNGVVINELMASNSETVADEAGEFDDWLELYNNNDFEVDLSGYFLTDDANELNKWSFAEGTVIPAQGYLIVWTDDDEEQGSLHTTFRLSADGEEAVLSNPVLEIVDQVKFETQTPDLAYARVPNGTGDFVIQTATFNGNNDGTVATNNALESEKEDILLFPVPANDVINIAFLPKAEGDKVIILNANGQCLFSKPASGNMSIDINRWPAGMYVVHYGAIHKKFIKID